MRESGVGWRRGAVTVMATVLLAACGGRNALELGTPAGMYEKAEHEMRIGAFEEAIRIYEQLEVQHPFSEEARQARLDLIYAYYRAHQPEQAVDAADTFIRENPRDPNVDYAYYLKGLVYFEFDRNFLEKLFRVDLCERPPNEAYKAFSNFSQLVQRYPESPYAADAHQRMVFLRNCFARYETTVAEYYMRRGAYVAAANRAKYAIETYPDTDATRDALELLASAYRELGMNDLATDSERVLVETFERSGPAQAAAMPEPVPLEAGAAAAPPHLQDSAR